MPSREEQLICSPLRTILANLPTGGDIPDSDDWQAVVSLLEQYVPATLAEIYPEWTQESLDGFYPLFARKTGEGELELFGLCLLISDQTTTPIHLRLQLSSSADEISWLIFRLGEATEHGMLRGNLASKAKHLCALEERADKIDWVCRVTFGQRRF